MLPDPNIPDVALGAYTKQCVIARLIIYTDFVSFFCLWLGFVHTDFYEGLAPMLRIGEKSTWPK